MHSTIMQEGDPCRLVISDYQMPEKDGVALAATIRDDPRLNSVPFILFTSIDKRLPPTLADQLKISSVVLKPIRIAELLSAVRTSVGICAPDGPARRSVSSTKEGQESLNPDLRILVAEYNPVNQRVISIQLNALGLAVDIVANGNEVLTALEKSEYDVILMDCQMPELDGFEATQCIRANKAYDDIKIIALTAGAMESDRENVNSRAWTTI